MQRVEDLANRSEAELKLANVAGVVKSGAFPKRPGFRMLVQLDQIIAEAMGFTPQSQKVKKEYDKMVQNLGKGG